MTRCMVQPSWWGTAICMAEMDLELCKRSLGRRPDDKGGAAWVSTQEALDAYVVGY